MVVYAQAHRWVKMDKESAVSMFASGPHIHAHGGFP